MDFLSTLEQRGERLGSVVLSGGLARRMGGQDKGLIEIGGRAMAGWVLDTVQAQSHITIINANRNTEAYAALGCEVVADRHTGHIGPLAGLSAAMHHLNTDYVFMCPCDSPFVDKALVDLLGSACLAHNADVAVAHDGDRLQPVFSVVHRQTLDSLDAYLASGERKIDRWYATQNMIEVDCTAFTNSFRNINTEEDRLVAGRELVV